MMNVEWVSEHSALGIPHSALHIPHLLYCELHAHSCYSLLDGVPFPEQLAERAHELGLPAIALTDHDAVYGLAPFYLRAVAETPYIEEARPALARQCRLALCPSPKVE